MSVITNLLVQAIGGALGGNAVGRASKNFDLGPVGNTISGGIGGGIGGQLLGTVIPALAGAATGGGFDIATVLGASRRGRRHRRDCHRGR